MTGGVVVNVMCSGPVLVVAAGRAALCVDGEAGMMGAGCQGAGVRRPWVGWGGRCWLLVEDGGSCSVCWGRSNTLCEHNVWSPASSTA